MTEQQNPYSSSSGGRSASQSSRSSSASAPGARSSRFAEWLYSHQKPEDSQIAPGSAGSAGSASGAQPQQTEPPSATVPASAIRAMDETLSELSDRLANIESMLRSTADTYKNLVTGIQKALSLLEKNQKILAGRFDRMNEVVTQAIQNAVQGMQAVPAASAPEDQTSKLMAELGPPPPTAPPNLLKDPTHVKARRIANAMVSDLEAYNRPILEEALRQGTIESVLAKQIADMRTQYERRVPKTVRDKHDYLHEALQSMIYRKKAEALGLQVPAGGGVVKPQSAVAPAVTAQPAPMAAAGATTLPPNITLAGPVLDTIVTDLIQLLSNNRDTGVFRVKSPRGTAEFFFIDGMIHDAKYGGLNGEKAFFEGFSIAEGQFEFEKRDSLEVPRNIEMETSFLIIEALRRMDEGNANVKSDR